MSGPKAAFQPYRERCFKSVLALAAIVVLAGCGDSDRSGAKLFPGRVSGVACDAKTGAPIAGATVIVTKWTGTGFDESPSTLVTTTGSDGKFEAASGGARRVEVEIGAEKYHPIGWLFSGKEGFCLEPVSARATAEIKTLRVGFEHGRPFGFRFDLGVETSAADEWDIGPTSAPSMEPDMVLQFRGKGGAVSVDADAGLVAAYFFERDFVAPEGLYESQLRVYTTRGCRDGKCWFFRDARGANYGKARLKVFSTGRDRERDWSVTFSYVYGSDGERHVEPKWRTVVPRYPVTK